MTELMPGEWMLLAIALGVAYKLGRGDGIASERMRQLREAEERAFWRDK